MDTKTVLFAVGTSLLIASAFVPASAATSAVDEAPADLDVCVRIDPNDPSVGVHQECDHTGDAEAVSQHEAQVLGPLPSG